MFHVTMFSHLSFFQDMDGLISDHSLYVLEGKGLGKGSSAKGLLVLKGKGKGKVDPEPTQPKSE